VAVAVGESSPTAGQASDLSGAWIDRDISWLEFNRRVLHEALDERTPLLERVKFLAIFSANLDEFFMKRMSRLADPTGLAAPAQRELAARIRAMVTSMLDEQAGCYTEVLRPRLAEHGIRLVGWDDLDAGQRDEASAMFERNISPVLTPLSLDAAHPFPYVSNLSTSWAFQLEDPVSGEAVLVRVKLPTDLPQWLRLTAVDPSQWVFVGLDQVIRANAERLFPGMLVASASLFRVCRDADVELDENDGLSKRAMVEEELRQRRFEPVVRLEVQPDADGAMVAELVDRFGLAPDDF
jgi:polyphosphate kinase